MTLHETTEFAKKFGVGTGIGIGAIIALVIVFRIGVAIKDVLLPAKIAPANMKLGALQPIEFPQSTVDGTFTYSINTVDGNLPADFPDRVVIYKMVVPKPDLNNLDSIKKKVQSLGFIDTTGNTLPEIPRGGNLYEWDEQTGLQRQIIYDTVSLNFDMNSNYLTSLDVLGGKNISDQTAAIDTAQSFLSSSVLNQPTDLNLDLTANPDPANDYTVKPQLYSIDSASGKLVNTTNLNDTRVIRVDFYQNPIEYKIDAASDGDLTHYKQFPLSLPIMYPNPPFSTMDFYVASGQNQAQVMRASYSHQTIDLSANADEVNLPTYPIKTAAQAFDDLKNGKGYIAAYNGTDTQIAINKVYLAYYIGKTTQGYLPPIIVFEGSNGFFAYVSALAPEASQPQQQPQ